MSEKPSSKLWHIRSSEQVYQDLDINIEQGLTEVEAKQRLTKYGVNELQEADITSPWAMLWEQLTDPMVLILIGAAVISAFLGDVKSVVAITTIVVLNAALGVSQEYRAEQAMAALKKMAASSVRVRRDGIQKEIQPSDLVPGDVILLEAGNIIPADARLVESANLQVQEASLTGESMAVDKTTNAIESETAPLGDRHNMVFLGTSVTYGRGTAVVVETGMQTELGRIADMIQNVQNEKTPLQRRMAQLGQVLFYVGIGIVVVAFIVGLIVKLPVNIAFLNAVAVAVAVVPEGLPAVVTISLALGAQRMLKRRALIRKLPAVETLGSVTIICSDKTGTLTENRMTVKILDVGGYAHDLTEIIQQGKSALALDTQEILKPQHAEALLLVGSVLDNDAEISVGDTQNDIKAIGDPTESALLVAGAQFGLHKALLEVTFPRIGEVPFSSERKRMTTIHEIDRVGATNLAIDEVVTTIESLGGRYVAFAKGGVDRLLDVCRGVWIDGTVHPMDDPMRERIIAQNDNLASEGLRVLGVAFRPLTEIPAVINDTTIEQDLIFTGMVGMIDPPRPEVRVAVRRCLEAGIRPIMITGDHPMTAQAIAHELNISRDDKVITGNKLAVMSAEELSEAVKTVNVFARVSPEHKLNIVQALQSQGHIVAMTGDGVNDAPALKRADIGVAMGITGTPVTKEASDMVILDDNFASIVSAAEEGRTIYDNVRKFIKYILASNTGEVLVLFIIQLLGMPLPLNTIQILWMNLVTDGLPALALGVEAGEPNAMKRPPYDPSEGIFARGLGWYLLRVGVLIAVVTFIVTHFAPYDVDPTNIENGARNTIWGTMIFTTLVMSQMGHALAIRSETDSVFKIGLFTNKAMLVSVGMTTVLQLVLIYVPFFNDFFYTKPLSFEQLMFCFGLAVLTFAGVELDKYLFRHHVNPSLKNKA